MVPFVKIGKEFVRELTNLFSAYAHASALEGIALEAATVACSLLLQKPYPTSKCSDHISALERRIKAWRSGDIDGVMREGRTIQHNFKSWKGKAGSQFDRESQNVRTFTRLVFEGKYMLLSVFFRRTMGVECWALMNSSIIRQSKRCARY